MSGAFDFGPSFFDKFGKEFNKGEIICCEYEPGNTFYFLLEGKVKITKVSEDKEKTLDILEPGEIFGEMSILEEAPRSATTVAVDKVKILEFNKENFSTLMSSKTELAIKLLKIFAKRIYDQKRRLMILTLKEPEARVMDVFIMLAEDKSIDITEKSEIAFKITPEEVANWCGMDKMKCTEVLTHFAKQNRIVLMGDKIIINNINDFYRVVNSKRRSSLQGEK